ncbi:acyltransferase [Pontibacter silvestris]|nr:acyltransferase [Pontibacter silvestris]
MFQWVGGIINLAIFLVFFFVLSSYLITKILLSSKRRVQEGKYTDFQLASVFLLRRTLRIFPAYYFYLLILVLLPYAGQHVRDNAASFFLYLSNFDIYFTQEWGELTPHLWTLAVEEQFYLIWPWVIIFTPEKYLLKVLYLVVISGVISRAVLYLLMGSPDEIITLQVLMPTCIDGFGLGALLAYQHINGKTCAPVLFKLLLIASPLYIISLFSGYPFLAIVYDRLYIALIAMVVIEGANKGFNNVVGRFLENKVVLYLAKISYGIYLYHIFAAFIFWKALNKIAAVLNYRFGLDISDIVNVIAIPTVSFFFYMIVSIVLAALSWHLLERPVNNLKRFFMYTAPRKVTPAMQEQVQEHTDTDPDLVSPELKKGIASGSN